MKLKKIYALGVLKPTPQSSGEPEGGNFILLFLGPYLINLVNIVEMPFFFLNSPFDWAVFLSKFQDGNFKH